MHDSKSNNNLTDSAVENPDTTMSFNSKNLGEKNLSATQLGSPLKREEEKTSVGGTNISAETGINQSHPENGSKRSRGKSSRRSKQSTEGKHAPRSMGSARVLRSRSQETHKVPEPGNNLQDISAGTSRENTRKKAMKKKKKKNQTKDVVVDEFSRTRKHLKYLLHRMAYEQNLIDAYSGEGWKGQSAEKLRPEKELQRAKSEIFRCKLKVRDLFQRIDVSITEGRLPQSLFDSEGEIDSEDIFCAKCGLKDVTLENDIILCDGACERAFHQFCVQPPLLNEDIPPDEDGWLCPGCDCKDDCIDLINESQGATLSILDSWEKVYPEVATAAGKSLDNLELPSDDSEDDDFKPDDSEVEEKDEGDESSSDESDTYSASEDSEVAPVNGPELQLSSDDSEDDDFDPDAADVDMEVKQASSGSDFTSDSEDLNALIDANKGSPHENSTMPNEFMPGPSKVGRGKRPSLNNELSSLAETSSSEEETALISARREVERLDYKKLYDEQYGDVPTDSSDEEFFDAVDAPKRRRKNNSSSEKPPKRRACKKLDTGGTTDSPINSSKVLSDPGSSVKTSASRRLAEAANQEQYGNVSTDSSSEEYFDVADAPKRGRKNNTGSVKTPKRRARKKLDTGGANDSLLTSNKVPSEPGSNSAKAKTSATKRLGEAVTQGLLVYFKENQYPDRAMKEKLAEDLGITTHQVSKWFENARWSFRHSSNLGSKLANIPSKETTTQINQSTVTLNKSVDDVKSGDQNEEPTNGKNHVPMDDTKDTSNSLETEQNIERKGRLNGRKSASSTPNKSSTKISSNNFSSNEDTQKPCGSSEVSKAPEKRTRARLKKPKI